MDCPHVDRSVFRVDSLRDESDERAYWRSRTPLERLQALELLRQINYGYDPATARLQRVLKLLNSHSVEYLVVGGYAVNYYGYPRSTGGIDIWVRSDATNAGKLRTALAEFGFGQATADLFLAPDTVIRMGVPPVRIEILTSVSGVTFGDCFRNRVEADVDGVVVPFVSFDDLKAN